MEKPKALFCWSGGKDSSLALYKVLQENKFEVVALLTTVNEEFKRVSMHGVREELIEAQARHIGLPLEKLYIPPDNTNEAYEKSMERVLKKHIEAGVGQVIFGDIFLEDLRKYRENNLAKLGLKAEFPLWKKDTSSLIHEFIGLGFKTVICCTHNDYFDDQIVGKTIDRSFVASLPSDVDPCGENGEFHTFTYDGPLFDTPLQVRPGEKILRTYEAKCLKDGKEETEEKGFWFIDLML